MMEAMLLVVVLVALGATYLRWGRSSPRPDAVASPTPTTAPAQPPTQPAQPPAPESPPGGPAFDPAEALEHCGGDEELLSTVLATMPDECRDRLRDIRAAIAANDPLSLKSAAHRLKGSLMVIGARPSTALARRLEQAGAAADVAPAAALAEALSLALDQLYAAIEAAPSAR